MTLKKFNTVIQKQFARCLEVLEIKGKEYVLGEDRLEMFKNAANDSGVNPKAALWGMVTKHITSLGAMCRTNSKNIELWDEKITDTINYLLLLRALIEEENNAT